MKKHGKKNIDIDVSSSSVHGNPHDAYDMINKFGTYEIQPTADSENDFPKIAGGLPKKHK